MPAQVMKFKEVVIRKDRNCFGCSRTFPKGTVMESQVIRNGKQLYTIHLCETCQDLVELRVQDGEEYYEGDFANLVESYESENY